MLDHLTLLTDRDTFRPVAVDLRRDVESLQSNEHKGCSWTTIIVRSKSYLVRETVTEIMKLAQAQAAQVQDDDSPDDGSEETIPVTPEEL